MRWCSVRELTAPLLDYLERCFAERNAAALASYGLALADSDLLLDQIDLTPTQQTELAVT